MISSIVIFGTIEFIIYSLSFGTCGYLIFRSLKLKEKKFLEISVLFVLLVLWEYWLNDFLGKLDLTIGNVEIIKLLGNNISPLFTVDLIDLLFSIFQIVFGYFLGKKMYSIAK